MQPRPSFLVFSDLDGTLLDHTTYSWDAARSALERLARLDIPVILATSKTAAETTLLQQEMGLTRYPAIVENGAGIAGLDGVTSRNAHEYKTLCAIVDGSPAQLRTSFVGFGDMSVEEVAQITGLSPEAASRAKSRDFSEPGLWSGSAADKDAFLSELSEHGVTAREGGRFLTLSFGKTKMDGMRDVMRQFRHPRSIALGDAANDIEMLESADFGVIVANRHHAPLPALSGEETGEITRTDEPGPAGWNTAINAFLDRHAVPMKG
ncbi:HAD-IIB family hydrolase [Cognatiyoonia sp. IB215446]|uniref:HAD-IIB family hydrolase n=1 Tax=Cognatiyoonia sp. IB215446 TaxID=3097355 RepID=UPI002A24C2EC|nr:HAD-IIB family hydrolase [Cognatiyoonia sp. IB215446]